MNKIIFIILLSFSMLHALGTIKVLDNCKAKLESKNVEVYFLLRGNSIEYYKGMNIMIINGYKAKNKNYKEVLSAWKRCNK